MTTQKEQNRILDVMLDLRVPVGGQPAVFFDGPAGSQVPHRVIEAVAEYLTRYNANHGGLFQTSQQSDAILAPNGFRSDPRKE